MHGRAAQPFRTTPVRTCLRWHMLRVEDRSMPVPANPDLRAVSDGPSRFNVFLRDDDRKEALTLVLQRVKTAAPGIKVIKSDMCPRYPNVVKKTFRSQVSHLTRTN